jgi:hypothetical protein
MGHAYMASAFATLAGLVQSVTFKSVGQMGNAMDMDLALLALALVLGAIVDIFAPWHLLVRTIATSTVPA